MANKTKKTMLELKFLTNKAKAVVPRSSGAGAMVSRSSGAGATL